MAQWGRGPSARSALTPALSQRERERGRKAFWMEVERHSLALRRYQVSGLEVRRVDDLGLPERHVGLRVLRDQHRRRPLLPVRAFAAREGDRAVPSLELVLEQCLDQRLA